MADDQSVPDLAETLRSGEVRGRAPAIQALWEIETPESHAALIGALSGSKQDLAADVARSITQMRVSQLSDAEKDAACDALTELLFANEPDIRYAAKDALRQFPLSVPLSRLPKSVQRLRRALADGAVPAEAPYHLMLLLTVAVPDAVHAALLGTDLTPRPEDKAFQAVRNQVVMPEYLEELDEAVTRAMEERASVRSGDLHPPRAVAKRHSPRL